MNLSYLNRATIPHASAHRYEEAKEKSTVDYCYALYHLDQANAALSIPASVNKHKARRAYVQTCADVLECAYMSWNM